MLFSKDGRFATGAATNVVGILLIMLVIQLIFTTEAFMQEARPKSYLVRLIGTREGWPENMTDDEKRIMSEHFVYLQELTLKGKVLMAGPVFDQFGMIVLRVSDEEEARQIMEIEPSVVQGVHRYEMNEMVPALIANNVYSGRYPAEVSDRELLKEASVKCSPEAAFQKWTTNAGIHSFLTENTNIQLRVGGPYEIYFDMEKPAGDRGSEDCKVLSFLPNKMLSFEWNAPPQMGVYRFIKTRVVVMFDAETDNSTRVALHHIGWGTDAGWDEVYNYFDRAWGSVMNAFKKSMDEGK